MAHRVFGAMTSPRKPTAGFWITVALVGLSVGHPLSIGPACWASSYAIAAVRIVNIVYHAWSKNSAETKLAMAVRFTFSRQSEFVPTRACRRRVPRTYGVFTLVGLRTSRP